MAVKVKRGDRRPGITIECKNGSAPAPLDQATSLKLYGKLAGTLIANRTVTGGADGKVVIDAFEATDTANSGTLLLEVEATWADGTKTTYPNDKYVEVVIVPDLG